MAKPERKPRTPPVNFQCPRSLFKAMRDALRAVEKDSRMKDRQLHDDTRKMVDGALDELATWYDSKVE